MRQASHLVRPTVALEALEARFTVSASAPATPDVVDVLVLYTPGALAFHNGNLATLTASVRGAADSANQAMVQSQIPAVFRVVGFQQVSYAGSDDLYLDRIRLETPGDGFLDEAAALRNQFGADLVTLIVETVNSAGGNGSLPVTLSELNGGEKVYSANAANSVAPGNLTLAHEWGHNLGAGHERGNVFDPAVGPFSYSYGYRFTASDGNVYHDVMSYDPGFVTFQYANPNVSYLGTATGRPAGDPLSADLYATFSQTVPVIAGFRPPAQADTTGPTAALYQASRRADGVLDFAIRWADPAGVDASTFDDDDLTVTVSPELGGFTLFAELIEVQNAAGVGGAYKLATYRVALPEPATPMQAISFDARPGAVRDSFGNLSSAASIDPNASATIAHAGFAAARFLGTLQGPTTIYESIEPLGFLGDDTFRFDVTAAGTISVRLDGLSADVGVFLARDADGNGAYDPAGDFLVGSFNAGTSTESFVYQAAAGGTYFAWVFGAGVSTAYELSIRQYVDPTAPVATLDATDIAAPQSEFVFNVIYEDNEEIDGLLARYYTPVRVTNPFGGFYIAFAESIDAQSNGPRRVVTYRINTGLTLSAADNGIYTVATEPHNSPIFTPPLDRQMSDAAGNPLAPAMLGGFRVAIGLPDSTPPTAALAAPLLLDTPRTAPLRFTVVYDDNRALDGSTLDNADIRVSGPNGFNQPAQLVSVAASPLVGGLRSAVYEVAGPGGTWDALDRGQYQIVLQEAQVRDAAGNAVVAGAIGTLSVTVPLAGDANRDLAVTIADFAILAARFNTRSGGFAGGDFNYDNITGIADFGLLAANFNQVQPSSPTARDARGDRSPRLRVADEIL